MADRHVTPGSVHEFTLTGGPNTAFPTGGAGTYGIRIDDGQGTAAVARATAGIVETGVAIYTATVTVPEALGEYVAIWDNGDGAEVSDDDTLVVVGNLPGTGLIAVADLDARGVEYADAAQAQAAIDDASAMARSYVAPVLDTVATPATPAAVVAAVVGMVRRGLTNPRGLAQETLGDYSYAAGTNAVATLLPTRREKVLLRQAAAAYALANDIDVPAWGAASPYMQADMPSDPFDDVGL